MTSQLKLLCLVRDLWFKTLWPKEKMVRQESAVTGKEWPEGRQNQLLCPAVRLQVWDLESYLEGFDSA